MSELNLRRHANWSTQFLSFLRRFQSAVQLWIFSAQCADVDDFARVWLIRVVLFPSLLLLLVAAAYFTERSADADHAWVHAKRNVELVAFFVYPSVVYAAFASLNCRALAVAPDGTSLHRSVCLPVSFAERTVAQGTCARSVLLDDDRTRCEDTSHRILK